MIFRVTFKIQILRPALGFTELAVGGWGLGILSLGNAEPWRESSGLGPGKSGFESSLCDL